MMYPVLEVARPSSLWTSGSSLWVLVLVVEEEDEEEVQLVGAGKPELKSYGV